MTTVTAAGASGIDIRGVRRRFGNRWALDGVDLQVRPGELFALVGPDGAGKTTLLQSICAILDPTEGEIQVGDFGTVKDAARITSSIGYVSQSYSLYLDLTVDENLEFFATIRNVPRDVYERRRVTLLSAAGLLPFGARRTAHLSGGMQKKLAVCCHLIHEPPILVLDEPSLAVDPISRRSLWELIRGYHQEGRTVLVATSYMDEAAICQRVALLKDGKVLACEAPSNLMGRLEQLFDTPRTEAVSFSEPQKRPDVVGQPVTAAGLTKRFGAFTAVDDVSFTIAKGEIVGLLGPNGSGKTTVIRMLCGIIAPTGGSVTVAGCDIAAEPNRVKTQIGYMSQRFSLYRDLTVDENIEFFGRVYGLGRSQLEARRTWALGFSDLGRQRKSLTGQLSAALTQRLALACALLHQPSVVFLDEPTSGVDPASRSSFWKIIGELAATGTSVLVTTHHLEEAEHCDRVAFMHRGRLLVVESPSELRRRNAMKSMEDIFVGLIEAAA